MFTIFRYACMLAVDDLMFVICRLMLMPLLLTRYAADITCRCHFSPRYALRHAVTLLLLPALAATLMDAAFAMLPAARPYYAMPCCCHYAAAAIRYADIFTP